jgi:hypothetical protein
MPGYNKRYIIFPFLKIVKCYRLFFLSHFTARCTFHDILLFIIFVGAIMRFLQVRHANWRMADDPAYVFVVVKLA